MRAHDRAVQHPAQPRLVACPGLISRLQFLLAPSPAYQVFLDNLYRARLERGRRQVGAAEACLATREELLTNDGKKMARHRVSFCQK